MFLFFSLFFLFPYKYYFLYILSIFLWKEKNDLEFVKRKLRKIYFDRQKIFNAKNTKLSPNFLEWEYCGKAQFPHSFGRITRNYAETVLFHKISAPEIRWNFGVFRNDYCQIWQQRPRKTIVETPVKSAWLDLTCHIKHIV